MNDTLENNINGKALLFMELAKFQRNMQGAKKDASNPHFKSKYADLESVVEAIKECSKDLNLSFTHIIEGETLKTYLVYSDGKICEYIVSELPLLTSAKTMQALGSSITYAKRYTLQSLYGIPSEDDDSNSASQSAPTFQKKEPPRQQPQPPKSNVPVHGDIEKMNVQVSSVEDVKELNEIYFAYKNANSPFVKAVTEACTARKIYLADKAKEEAQRPLEQQLDDHIPV